MVDLLIERLGYWFGDEDVKGILRRQYPYHANGDANGGMRVRSIIDPAEGVLFCTGYERDRPAGNGNHRELIPDRSYSPKCINVFEVVE
ncbi:hypothetical protein J4443_00465 [Candidatus Woesearchaeota archaeon]|nr:hypothetical protein [Candidatus Woesearchaeota archaeon]